MNLKDDCGRQAMTQSGVAQLGKVTGPIEFSAWTPLPRIASLQNITRKKLTKLQRTNREKMFAESFVQLDSQHGPDHLISPPTWWQCWCNMMGSKRGSNQPFPENNKRFHQKPTFSSLADAPLLAVIFVTVPFLVSIFVLILMIISKVILLPITISMMIGQFDWLAIQC